MAFCQGLIKAVYSVARALFMLQERPLVGPRVDVVTKQRPVACRGDIRGLRKMLEERAGNGKDLLGTENHRAIYRAELSCRGEYAAHGFLEDISCF